jgi:hypothetical protein
MRVVNCPGCHHTYSVEGTIPSGFPCIDCGTLWPPDDASLVFVKGKVVSYVFNGDVLRRVEGDVS